MTFYYYQKQGKTKQLLATFDTDDILAADELFEEKTGINPARDKSIVTTLEPLTSGETQCS